MKRTAILGEFKVLRNDDLHSALQGLLQAYPATHYCAHRDSPLQESGRPIQENIGLVRGGG